ncbi:hypothetical protein MTR67_003849 [Solanum verrucosum]|uniref:Uncharacterized protein n=1 Tax=Solanum verrucosum TaxID=315347 RepID=A0AAF0TA15_SOLVR|nr:hypothetical protein MTR67_003849 [Solanum verrucosum]
MAMELRQSGFRGSGAKQVPQNVTVGAFRQHFGLDHIDSYDVHAETPVMVHLAFSAMSCINVVLHFISPENVAECINVTDEIRLLPEHHKARPRGKMLENIPGVTTEKIDLEPLSKDEKEVNQIHQCLDEIAPTTRNIPGVTPKEVELEPLGEDEWDANKMHQCAYETNPTKKTSWSHSGKGRA